MKILLVIALATSLSWLPQHSHAHRSDSHGEYKHEKRHVYRYFDKHGKHYKKHSTDKRLRGKLYHYNRHHLNNYHNYYINPRRIIRRHHHRDYYRDDYRYDRHRSYQRHDYRDRWSVNLHYHGGARCNLRH